MHVPRVFIDTAIAVQATVKLDGAKHHHLRNVLRLKPADAVILKRRCTPACCKASSNATP